MSLIRIYHNNRCRKSREALQILEESGLEFEVREYLKEPLTLDELKALHKKLGIPAEEMIRKNEADYKDNFKGKEMDDNGWLKAIEKFPKLLERAVIESDDKAVIARPPEKTKEVL